MTDFESKSFRSEGTTHTLRGNLHWESISEDTLLYDEEGNADASLFSFSYFLKDAQENRPVLFAWNGGPGSSSLWLHTGMLGAKKMKYEDVLNPRTVPPFEMEDNPYWLLDVCDIVLIDPIGTGYSRLLNNAHRERYYTAREDAKTVAEFIFQWLRKYKRLDSPVYIMGESYGTIRASLVAQELTGGPLSADHKLRGICLKGAILMGSSINVGTSPLPVSEDPMNLFTEAAVHWYHQPQPKKELREAMEENWKFATEDYLIALYKNHTLSSEERQKLAEKLEEMTGIRASYYLTHDFRVSLDDYAKDIDSTRGFDVGAYDGRYRLAHVNDGALPVTDDPAMGMYQPSMINAINGEVARTLNIDIDREYQTIAFGDVLFQWKYDYMTTPIQCLELAARRNSDFKLMLAAGLYDMTTSSGYARALKAQLNIPESQLIHREYESGHMAYMGDDNLKAICDDIRNLIIG